MEYSLQLYREIPVTKVPGITSAPSLASHQPLCVSSVSAPPADKLDGRFVIATTHFAFLGRRVRLASSGDRPMTWLGFSSLGGSEIPWNASFDCHGLMP